MFWLVITLIVLMPKNVLAIGTMSEEFKQILNEDGKLVVTDTSMNEDKNAFLTEYLRKKLYGNVSNYNQENSTCDITINGETHTIEIIYDEKISEEFKKILNEEGKLPISSSSKNGVEHKINSYLTTQSQADENYSFSLDGYSNTGVFTYMIDENYTKATIKMRNKNGGLQEQHIVEFSYLTEKSEEFQKLLNEDGKRVINAVKPDERK